MTKTTRNESESLTSTRHGLQSQEVIRDLLLTLAAALWTGMAASMLFILLVFVTSTEVLASEDGPGRGNLSLYTLDGRWVDDAPLVSTDVQIEIHGMLARVVVVQQFSHSGVDWLEGIYQFPLPENSAVEKLRMKIGDRLLEGEIQESKKARARYEKAKSTGRRASLLSQQRPNIFTTSVANIGPGEVIRIEIEYQQTLHYDQGRFHLRFPMVVGPRYIPGTSLAGNESIPLRGTGWALDTDQVPDASQITPPVADPRFGPVNPVSLSIRLNPSMAVEEIHSPYHELVQQLDEQGVYQLNLKAGAVPADRDFELQWQPKTGQTPRAVIFSEEWEGQDYALLMLVPPELEHSATGSPREVIFVVDTSGSMHGASIKQAKAALQLALRQLQPVDRFNLIQFNSHTQAMFKDAMPATRRNVAQALQYIGSLEAGGGTEMLPAMRLALQDGSASSRLRQVIFLTDGSVGNEQELFNLIERELADSRLFTIGIGSAPNGYFMQRAAEFGRGSHTYIGDLSEVQSRMQVLFDKLKYPVLTDIQIAWSDRRTLESYPAKVPDLYRGEPLLVALKADELSGDLGLQGQIAGSHWQQALALQKTSEQPGIHTLWGRAKIKHLMAGLSHEADASQVPGAILELALKHQLLSRYTSLVVVDRTPVRTLYEGLQQRAVLTNLPHGWTASKVFGRLPQTGTAAQLHLLIGLGLLLLALLIRLAPRIAVK